MCEGDERARVVRRTLRSRFDGARTHDRSAGVIAAQGGLDWPRARLSPHSESIKADRNQMERDKLDYASRRYESGLSFRIRRTGGARWVFKA